MASVRRNLRRFPSRVLALATVAASLAAAPKVQAVAYTFDGTFSNGLWNYSNFFGITNWTGNTIPVSAYSTDIYFGAAGSTANLFSNMNFGSFALRSLNFRTTGSVNLVGNAISIAGGGVVNAGSGTAYSMSNALTLNGNGSATNSVGFGIVGSLTSTGVISGAGNLFKYGAGTLVLNAANTYTGGTTVSEGRLQVAAPNGDYLNNANLEFATTGTSTYAGAISGTGAFTKSGAGTLTLSGVNAYAGGTTINGGRLIELNPHGTYVDNAALEFQLASDLNFSSSITGTGSFTKSGAGNLSLTGTDAYTGGTTVAGGRLTVATPHGNYVDNAALEFVPAADRTFSGVVSGTGSLTKSGTKALTLGASSNYSGATVINGGSLLQSVDNTLPTSTALTVNAGGIFNLNGKSAQVGSLSGAGDVYLAGTFLTVSGSTDSTFAGKLSFLGSQGGGALIKYGTSTLTLSGSNTFVSAASVKGGTLRNGANDVLYSQIPLNVDAAATYDLNGFNQTIGSLSGDGKVTLGSGTLTVAGVLNSTFSGVMSGTGPLLKNGNNTLTLSGANTYSGGTTVNGGRLVDAKPHGSYVTNAALEFNLVVDNFLSGIPEYGNSISGTGSLTRSGSGTVRFTAPTTYTGGTFLNGGYTVVFYPHGTYNIGSGTLAFNPPDAYEQTMPITGAGSFDLVNGTVTLSAVNTYSGLTTVFSGSLIDLHPHGNYRPLHGTLKLVNETDVNIGLSSGSGAIVKAGAGTLTMSGGGVGRPGVTTVEEGRLIDNAVGMDYVTNAELELGGASFPGSTSVSGSGNLTKSGTGTLNLASTDTYTGNTTIKEGRLKTQKPHGSYVDNGELEVNTGGTLGFGGTITGTGSFTLTGTGGRLTLSGINTYTGVTTNKGESLTDLHPHGNYWTWSELILTSDIDAAVGNVTGQSPGRLVKNGAGTLTVASTTSLLYTDVQAGRLILLAPVQNQQPYRVSAGANLEFSNASDLSIGAPINGDGSFTKSGTGILTLGYIGSSGGPGQHYGGSTTVAAGTLRIAKNDLLPTSTALVVNSAATFDLNNFNQTVGSLAGSGSVLLGSRTLTVNGVSSTLFSGIASGTGLLVKNGSGTLTLAGVNTYSGGTTVSGGRLVDQNPHGTYLDNAILEFAPNGAVSFAGSDITGTGNFVKGGAGTLTLTAPIAASGTIDLAGGILKGSTAIFDRNVGSTGGILQFDQTSDGTYARIYSGAGSLLKTGAGTFTLTAANTYTGTTTVSGGTLRNGATNALGTTTDLVVNAGATYSLTGFNQTVGSLTGAGKVLLQGGKTLTVNSGTDGLFSGVISDTGAFVKGGAGTMTLSGANTYSGGTTVNAGRLIDQNPHGKYVTNADLEFRNAGNYNQGLDAGITGTGNFTKSGGGTLVLLEPNSYGGATALNEGTTYLSGRGSLPSSTALTVASGATFAFPFKSQTVASLWGFGTVDLSYSVGLTVNGSTDSTFGGSITYDGRLIKDGTGTLTLAGVNRYTGSTFIYGGRLIDQNPHGAYFNSASLEFDTATTRTFNDWIVGTGSFTKSGAGTLTLSGYTPYTGGTTVNAGRLIDQNPHGNYVDNAALEFQGFGGQSHSGVISGTGSLTKTGGGTLVLSGVNTYSGGTTVSAGRLVDQNPHGGYVTNAALELANVADKSLTDPISGTGSLTKSGAGTLTLSGAATYGGGTTVNEGTLRITGEIGGSLNVAADATLNNASSGLTFGASTLQGTLRTSNITHFTGLVSGPGSFTGPGTVDFQGGYSPGNSPASVTFEGDLTLGATNDLTMELGGTALGTDYDHLNVLGSLNFGGNLVVASLNGFSPALGQSFDLFDFSSSNGTFASISLPTLDPALKWNTSLLYTNGSIQAVPEPASLAALGLGALALLRRRRR